jgi:glycosyltransferase involved in cell wall biosynthesis
MSLGKVCINYRFIRFLLYTCCTFDAIYEVFHRLMSTPPRILMLIPHLGGGGAERVMALVARGLSAEKYELHLGLVTDTETSEAMPSGVEIHALGARRVRGGAVGLLRLVRRVKPDLILSGMFHLYFLVLLLRPFFPRGTRVLIRQNGTVSAALAFGGVPWYTRLLYRRLYHYAEGVICQSRAMADDLSRELGLAESRMTVLPNPVDVEEILRAGEESDVWAGRGPHLLAVGRLAREKGYDLLLQALVQVRMEFPEAELLIAGAGAEEAALKAEREALGLEEAVHFAGAVARPWSYFPGATLFVLPSRQEGMPNALLEAAAAGLPIVALPACGGVVELLREQAGVWLAPEITAEALAEALLEALHALRPGERFTHGFIDEFRLDRAMQGYERLIDETLGQP